VYVLFYSAFLLFALKSLIAFGRRQTILFVDRSGNEKLDSADKDAIDDNLFSDFKS